MHNLQPKHSKLKQEDVLKFLAKYGISASQLPKIKAEDPLLPEKCNVGDIIKIERKEEDKTYEYFRVVV